jgi:hypothetical protein
VKTEERKMGFVRTGRRDNFGSFQSVSTNNTAAAVATVNNAAVNNTAAAVATTEELETIQMGTHCVVRDDPGWNKAPRRRFTCIHEGCKKRRKPAYVLQRLSPICPGKHLASCRVDTEVDENPQPVKRKLVVPMPNPFEAGVAIA